MLFEDRATTAWRELGPRRVNPTRIDVLTAPLRQTTVFRLVDVGNAESAVIAKRCRHEVAVIERSVYEEILPELSCTSLEYYGCVEEPPGEFSWLFVEDASGDTRYRPGVELHRVAAGRWLGVMNVSATGIPAARRLPQRGPDHYLKLLESASGVLLGHFVNAALDDDDRAVIAAVLSHCRHLTGNWSRVACMCEGMPQTLVHGDFISNNVRVRTTENEISILPFDWEKAGWGVPAEDISRVDIPTYSTVVRHRWPELSSDALERLADLGKIFRCLVFLDWIAQTLDDHSAAKSIAELRRCETWLNDLSHALGWRD